MTSSTTYQVNYVSDHSLTPYELRHRNYLIPFHFDSKDQILVHIDDKRTTDFLVSGSQIILNSRPADNSLIRISRHTELSTDTPAPAGDMAQFKPGHPIKAGDLNDNYSWLVQRIEELESLVKNQAYLSSTEPPADIVWKGFIWINTTNWVQSVYNGNQFVEVSNQ